MTKVVDTGEGGGGGGAESFDDLGDTGNMMVR